MPGGVFVPRLQTASALPSRLLHGLPLRRECDRQAGVPSPIPNGLHQSRWSKRIGQSIELVCFLALIAVFVTVIYGFWLRAIWAQGYFLAVALTILGAFVVLIGLAQQAVAARDVATWREMAEWQIRAARARVAGADAEDVVDPDSAAYYEMLIGTLVHHADPADPVAGPR